jgi:hypothetical protein
MPAECRQWQPTAAQARPARSSSRHRWRRDRRPTVSKIGIRRSPIGSPSSSDSRWSRPVRLSFHFPSSLKLARFAISRASP